MRLAAASSRDLTRRLPALALDAFEQPAGDRFGPVRHDSRQDRMHDVLGLVVFQIEQRAGIRLQ